MFLKPEAAKYLKQQSKMATSNKKKQEEENNLRVLREMVALPHNKHCFDCNQRGPTYVNMTIGSFVCTACSGQLRGLNPPHRVKSISMASFSNEEMEFIKSRGNDFCRKVWLGLHDKRSLPDADMKDEGKLRDAMSQRYEKKRWYIQPTEAFYEEAKLQNVSISSKQPAVKPLSTLVGNNLPPLNVQPNQLRPVLGSTIPPHSAIQRPTGHGELQLSSSGQPSIPSSPQSPNLTTPTQQTQKPTSLDAVLADFGSDPFVGPSNATQQSVVGNFADFSAFNQPDHQMSQSAFPAPASLFQQQQPQHPTAAHNWQQPSLAATVRPPPGNSSLLMPTQNSSGAHTTAPAQNAPINIPVTSDKYSALAELEGVFSSPAAAPTAVNWDGTIKSNIWGSSIQPASGGYSHGGPPQPAPPQVHPPSYASLSVNNTVSNPFGVSSTLMSSSNQPMTVNPFMVASNAGMQPPRPAAYGQFGQPQMAVGPPGMPAGYGQFSAVQPSVGVGGQFGMQNGGMGVGAWPNAAAPPQPGQVPQQMAVWGRQQAVPNPFGVAPSNSGNVTNPFL